MSWYTYILASKKNGTLYVGVTNNLQRRMQEHKDWAIEWFTKKYGLKNLVYYEEYENIYEAIVREKQLKNRRRDWKINLIEGVNSNRDDLSMQL